MVYTVCKLAAAALTAVHAADHNNYSRYRDITTQRRYNNKYMFIQQKNTKTIYFVFVINVFNDFVKV